MKPSITERQFIRVAAILSVSVAAALVLLGEGIHIGYSESEHAAQAKEAGPAHDFAASQDFSPYEYQQYEYAAPGWLAQGRGPNALPASSWPKYLPKTGGQIFVIGASVVLVLSTLASIIAIMIAPDWIARYVAIGAALLGAGLCVIAGTLELWYATGFTRSWLHHLESAGHYQELEEDPSTYRDAYNKSWAAATALYLFAAILYGLDFVGTLCNTGNCNLIQE